MRVGAALLLACSSRCSPCLPAPPRVAAAGHTFATRMTNVFVIGKGDKPMISLPKGKGIRQTILQEQAKMYAKAQA
jgi:hypothetical protein